MTSRDAKSISREKMRHTNHTKRALLRVKLRVFMQARRESYNLSCAPVTNAPQSPPAVGYLVEEDEVRVLLRLRARLSSSRTPAPLISLAHRVSVTLRRSTVAVVPFPSAITASARCSGPCSRQRLQTADARRSTLDADPLQNPEPGLQGGKIRCFYRAAPQCNPVRPHSRRASGLAPGHVPRSIGTCPLRHM